jgi:RNA polymerase sigma-70 factor (ECF subfamily)
VADQPRSGKERALSEGTRELVRRCLAGEQAAMQELVRVYQDQVFGLCYRMLGHRQDAEDAAQETLVRALRSLKNWDAERPLAPWLLAIAGNRCRSALASRSRRPAAILPAEDVADRPDGLAEVGSLAEEVGLALEGLRTEYRQAFELFHEQELSYAEIAAALDCPVGTVKTWVHRARRELIGELVRRGVLEESRDALRAV